MSSKPVPVTKQALHTHISKAEYAFLKERAGEQVCTLTTVLRELIRREMDRCSFMRPK